MDHVEFDEAVNQLKINIYIYIYVFHQDELLSD